MSLPFAIAGYANALSDDRVLAWDHLGFDRAVGPRKRPPNLIRPVLETTAFEHPLLPLEQIELLERAIGQGRNGRHPNIAFLLRGYSELAERYLTLDQGAPKIRYEHILEFQEVRTRVVATQLECWLVASRLHGSERIDGTTRLSVVWPAATPTDCHELELRLERPLVDAHVHLGSVLGTEDLWHEILSNLPGFDRMLARLEKHRFPPSVSLSARFFHRLRQMKTIRGILAREMRRVLSRFEPAPGSDADLDWLVSVELEMASQGRGAEGGLAAAVLRSLFRNRPELDLDGRIRIQGRGRRPCDTLRACRGTREPDDVLRDSVLCSERAFLVDAFRILLGSSTTPAAFWFEPLLAVYLVTQNMFHRQLVEQGPRSGFDAFLGWFESPARRLMSNETPVRQERILRRLFSRLGDRAEGRITPEIPTVRTWLASVERHSRNGGDRSAIGLTVHFIKKRDESAFRNRKKSTIEGPDLRRPRFCELRKTVRAQALALERFRRTDEDAGRLVVAIDAARCERDTPPEVFAPTFRYLRRDTAPLIERWRGSPLPPIPRTLTRYPVPCLLGRETTLPSPRGNRVSPPALRATFHAGEWFNHPVSGLRAVYEAAVFLDLSRGDRIGHGFALGLDPADWSRRINPQPLVEREEYLDDLAWMAMALRQSGEERLLASIEREISAMFPLLYRRVPGGNDRRPLTQLLERAWKLRWMDPEVLSNALRLFKMFPRGAHSYDQPPPMDLLWCQQTGECPLACRKGRPACVWEHSGGWSSCLSILSQATTNRRYAWICASMDLAELFREPLPFFSLCLWKIRQFDAEYRWRAVEPVRWSPEVDWCTCFDALREFTLKELEARQVVVEVCPSSNWRIGGLDSLRDHSIFRFDREFVEQGRAGVEATINTDNPGVFSTHIRNEYALIARAAEEGGMLRKEVLQWIERLIERGHMHCFLPPSGQESGRGLARRR